MGYLLKYLFCFAHFLLFLPCQPCFPERRAPGETLWCAHAGKGGQACFGSFSCIYPREQLSFISWFSLWSARDKLLFHSSLKIILRSSLGKNVRRVRRGSQGRSGAGRCRRQRGAEPCSERPRVPAAPAIRRPPARPAFAPRLVWVLPEEARRRQEEPDRSSDRTRLALNPSSL